MRIKLLAALVFVLGGGVFAAEFFWESPLLFVETQASFPQAASGGGVSVVAWQEAEPLLSGGRITIHLSVYKDGAWGVKRAVGGPYNYGGSEPSIFNLTVDEGGRIFISVGVTVRRSEILVSDDAGVTFNRYTIESPSGEIVAPKIFSVGQNGNNTYLLFMTRRVGSGSSIYYARSADGYQWTDWEPFVTAAALSLNYLPSVATAGNTIYIVFQSFLSATNLASTFQLFIKTSVDGGFTWTDARRLTDFMDPAVYQSADPGLFNNERPHLSIQNGLPFLVWERRYGNYAPGIYGAVLDTRGFITESPFRIYGGNAECQSPIAVPVEGETAVLWFDNRDTWNKATTRNRVYLAQRTEDGIWTNRALSSEGDAVLARPILLNGDFSVFWQSENRLYLLLPDISTSPPFLAGDNFTDGRPISRTQAAIRWRGAKDSSGIAGYAYSWGRDPGAVPPEELMILEPASGSGAITEETDEDGTWYFSLRSRDNAGNWSAPVTIAFIRDTTPPPQAEMLPLPVNERGYLTSNTFSFFWKRPAAPDLEGYIWNLELLDTETDGSRNGEIDSATEARYRTAGAYLRGIRTISGRSEQASYNNIDDGLWRFSLAPVDHVGNTGPESIVYFRTNKYIPHTFITFVDYRQDEQGDLSLRIIGRGFARDGIVTRLYLGRDGEGPERELVWQSGKYTVISDREIAAPLVENLKAGLYYVGVTHPVRGSYTTRPTLHIGPSQTIKYGDFSQTWQPSWTVRLPRRITFNAAMLVPALVVLFSLALAYYSIHGLAVIIQETATVRRETAAILRGEAVLVDRKRRITKIKLRGVSLRIKLVLFTTALVVAVVGMVSAPVYVMMDTTERETLLQGLWERSTVLLESVASNARTFLPSNNVLELGYLPEQTAAIPEAVYVTITGHDGSSGIGSDTFGDYVWATNDPDILRKIDTATLQPGVSRLTDALTPKLSEITGELNERASRGVSGLAESISSLTQEALSLSLRVDEESLARIIDIQASTRSLEGRLTEQLNEIGREIGSEPEYLLELSPDNNRRFILFKPVLFRQGSSDIYYRGLVRLEINTESIERRIIERRISLFRVIAIVATIAIVVGFIGVFVLATLIILPIRRLVAHIETIRDTDDKSKLEGKDIHITTRDELSVLGDTINDMTHGLVKAALAAADLSIGKEIQKKFIPLDLDSDKNKRTSGFKSHEHAEFFGYYEGAKGVSGDYFNYLSLDDRYFAIIKCDVAGKGIPAALIMIQVATMFINHFKSWQADEKGMRIDKAVYQINDFIETLEFQGRFAAFTLVLFDSLTGEARFCNAGDNIVHWFDAAKKRMRRAMLPETPATGFLPNHLVEENGGYPIQRMTFNAGDILLLYTDGVEEAKRLFRDENFEETECREGDAPPNTPHDTHVVGQDSEEIGAARQEAIINAAMNRGSYQLYKYHNPEGEGTLDFDFATCAGTTEDLIMAMVCAEKVFRMYKNPRAGNEARVLVDQKVDAFLKKHFIQYAKYCSRTAPAETPGYLYYLGVQEDEQYDDLTILGVRRK
ncbi:MAG: SpoIIE family protein phosphatase [Spirochaetaceae bacterium]|jgi:serine phosphatase RsbU (regulator of sigma subunit)|nr:SpoIIE family protein phosphatase [Spirochaetaceae bacterium]